MTPPLGFVQQLKREFPDLRIRWSAKKQEWHIEQKVGRGHLPPFRLDPSDDSLIRARDGYWFVCAVRPGDRMPCPVCGATLKVPVLRFAEVRCPACYHLNRGDGRVMAAYFPLGPALLAHLRSTDPRRDAIKRMAKEADEANQKHMKAQKRALSNHIEAATKEDFNQLFSIPSVGYTGRVFRG